jgi:GntP family gluconate:H+ symporter
MSPLVLFAAAFVLVSILLVRLKLNAFVALIAAAVFVGLASPRIALPDVMKTVGESFGSVAGGIAIAIAMAAIVGDALTRSGAADRIVRSFVRAFGEARASLSLVASGYVLGIPVFFDTVFYLLVPLARAMSVRVQGRQYVLLVLAISAGGSATHVFVPPTPGPLVMAATLGVDLGLTILVGMLVALPASLAGWLYAVWIDRRLGITLRDAPGGSPGELQTVAARPESELPGLFASAFPIFLPVALVGASTICRAVAPDRPAARVLSFLGDASFSLMLAAAAALVVMARHLRLSFAETARTVERSLASAGVMILITAGGGAFGGMLVKAGVGEAIGGWSERVSLSPLLLGFLLASLFKLAQGSGTVAMITAASILKPLAAGPLPFHPVYLVMAVGAGSLVGQWMNDSGFWIYRTLTGLTEVETLKSKSVMMAVMGAVALLATVVLSLLLPLRS